METPRILDTAPIAEVGEGPTWDGTTGRFWWVDIKAPALYRTDPRTGATERWAMPADIGSFALCRSGAVLVALRNGIHRFDPRDGALDLVAAPEPDRPMNRLNDGKASPEGRFLVGSMDDRVKKQPTAALWRLDPGARDCAKLCEGLLVSNGLAWSPDGRTLWHSDSRRSVIWTWDYDPATGAIANRREVARPTDAQGRPDGAAVDAEGGYWSAGVTAGTLNRWLPDGTLDRVVAVPVKHPTMPCFGGADMRQVFVTSLRRDDAGENCGRVVVLDLGVAGVEVGRFGD